MQKPDRTRKQQDADVTKLERKKRYSQSAGTNHPLARGTWGGWKQDTRPQFLEGIRRSPGGFLAVERDNVLCHHWIPLSPASTRRN